MTQSVYRKFHSTESALLKIYPDIWVALSREHVTFFNFCFIYIRAAFDAVDHETLLIMLDEWYGVSGYSLVRLKSTTEHIVVSNQFRSTTVTSNYVVPQGLVLRPLLFIFYTKDVTLSDMALAITSMLMTCNYIFSAIFSISTCNIALCLCCICVMHWWDIRLEEVWHVKVELWWDKMYKIACIWQTFSVCSKCSGFSTRHRIEIRQNSNCNACRISLAADMSTQWMTRHRLDLFDPVSTVNASSQFYCFWWTKFLKLVARWASII